MASHIDDPEYDSWVETLPHVTWPYVKKSTDESLSLPELMRADLAVEGYQSSQDPEIDAKWRAFNEWMCSDASKEKMPIPLVQNPPAPVLSEDQADELAHKQWHEDQKWTGPKKIVLGEWASIEDFCKENPAEAVDHPVHYQGKGGLEVIDIIEGFGIGELTPTSGFTLGNLLKYILRAGKKDDYLQDLNKAKWFLSREITNEELRRKDGKA